MISIFGYNFIKEKKNTFVFLPFPLDVTASFFLLLVYPLLPVLSSTLRLDSSRAPHIRHTQM